MKETLSLNNQSAVCFPGLCLSAWGVSEQKAGLRGAQGPRGGLRPVGVSLPGPLMPSAKHRERTVLLRLHL